MSTMRAVQVVGYHQNLEMKEVPVPGADRAVRRRRQDRRRRRVPDRPAHPGRPVGREDPGLALPYTIGHENAGWVHAVGRR